MKRQKRAAAPQPAWTRGEGGALFAIALFSAGLRLAALFSFKSSPYFDTLLWDERLIHTLAAQIADGTFKSATVYEMAPLPLYVSAFLYKVFSPDIVWVRWMNVFLGSLTPVVVSLIGRRLGGRWVGCLSGVAAALYGPFLFYSVVPLKTALSVFLFSLFLLALLRATDEGSYGMAAFSGLLLGLAVSVRPNMLVLFGAAAVAFGWPVLARKRGALFSLGLGGCLIVGFSLAVLPFMVRNARVAGDFTLTASQAGFNLYSSNNPGNPLPYYRPVPFASSSPFVQGIHYTIEASRRSQRTLSPQEASRYWTTEVVSYANRDPARFWANMGRKILVFFNRFEAGDHYHMGFTSRFVPFFQVPWLAYGLVMPLGVAGLLWALFRHRHGPTLVAVYALYGATLVLFFTNTRYRLPMMGVLIPLAVWGGQRAFVALRTPKRMAAVGFMALAGLFAGVEHLPVRGTTDMTAYWNTHAMVINGAGRTEEAIRWWTRSAETRWPYASYGRLALAGAWRQGGDTRKARGHLAMINKNELAGAARFEMEGDMAAGAGRHSLAVRCYLRSLTVNSGVLRVYEKMRTSLVALGRDQEAEKVARKAAWVASFY